MTAAIKATTILVAIVMAFSLVTLSSDDSAADPTDGWDQFTDTSWYTDNQDDSEYILSDAADLAGLASLVNSNGVTFEGKTITLTTGSYDLSEHYWVPIGNSARTSTISEDTKVFSGTFDGAGSTISGITDGSYTPSESSLDGEEFLYGLFGFTNNATIRNIVLTNVNIDVYDDGSTHGNSVGALVGYGLGTLTISGVSVSGSVTAEDAVAGVVGRFYGTSLSISDSDNSATVSSPVKTGGSSVTPLPI